MMTQKSNEEIYKSLSESHDRQGLQDGAGRSIKEDV